MARSSPRFPIRPPGGGERYSTPVAVLGDFNGDAALDVATPYTAINDASASVEVVLNTGGTYRWLSSSANPSSVGHPLTFKATVTESVAGVSQAAPTGSVTFKDGSTTLATVALASGIGRIYYIKPGSGIHSITATYLGNSHYKRHKSAVLSQRVQ